MKQAKHPRRGTTRGPYAGSRERRDAIIDAAFAVFSRHGYSKGSLRMIADRVGMSQTSLLYYFPRKSDLLEAVLRRRDKLGNAELTAGDGEFADRVVERARRNEDIPGLVELYTVLAGEAVTAGNPGRGYIARRMEDMRVSFGRELRELARRGRLRPGVDPDVAASNLIALWEGLQTQWLLAPQEISVPDHLRAYLDAVLVPAEAPDQPPAGSPEGPPDGHEAVTRAGRPGPPGAALCAALGATTGGTDRVSRSERGEIRAAFLALREVCHQPTEFALIVAVSQLSRPSQQQDPGSEE